MVTNIIIGILLGFSIFKIGEFISSIISKSRFTGESFDETLLDKKNSIEWE